MNHLKTIPDSELIKLLKNDCESALKELYNRYWPRLYAFAYQRVRCKETAEEHVQEFLCKLWINRGRLQIELNFNGFAYASLKNIILGHYRRSGRFETIKSKLRERYVESENSTEDLIMVQDLNKQVNLQINFLPEKCRSVFKMSRFQYMNNREISQYLGISEKTVEGHLTKALKQLRRCVHQAAA